MPSARGTLAVSAFALSLVVAASPVRSAPSEVVGTVVKQLAPVSIDTCTAALDGDVYTPAIALHPDARVVVVQTFALTFFDASGKTSGHALVTPPFAPAIADGGSFAAMKCEIAELRLDDGSTYSNAPPSHDSHAFVNAFIGIGILAAVGFLASRNNDSGHAPMGSSAAGTPAPTPTPVPVGTASGAATAVPTSVPTAVRLIVTPSAAPSAVPASSVAHPELAFPAARHR